MGPPTMPRNRLPEEIPPTKTSGGDVSYAENNYTSTGALSIRGLRGRQAAVDRMNLTG